MLSSYYFSNDKQSDSGAPGIGPGTFGPGLRAPGPGPGAPGRGRELQATTDELRQCLQDACFEVGRWVGFFDRISSVSPSGPE